MNPNRLTPDIIRQSFFIGRPMRDPPIWQETTWDEFEYTVPRSPEDGLFLEFGTFQGDSTWKLARKMMDHGRKQKLYTFDSFLGLPESWHELTKSTFTTDGVLPIFPDEVSGKIEVVEGWYDETLPSFLGSHQGSLAYANIDCDCLSSTRTVLQLLQSRIASGTLLRFDEIYGYDTDDACMAGGELLAFNEMLAASPFGFEVLCHGHYTAVLKMLA